MLDYLYSEELGTIPYKTEQAKKKPGWLKKTALGIAISLPLVFGHMDKDYIGPKEVHAAGNGYISAALCPPNPEPQQSYYYKWFVTRQDNGQVTTILVPSSRLRVNFTGLDEGVVYEIKAQICYKDQNGTEQCSTDSANKPLGVAKIYGNADTSSVSGTINRVDSYDSSKCYSVYTGRITDPVSRQICDFSGNYNPDMTDYNYYLRPNIGKVQANPLGTVYEDCSGGKCPETDTCSQPY